MTMTTTAIAAAQVHITAAADGIFNSGLDMAYLAEGLMAAFALVAGTMATISKSTKEGAGTALGNQMMVIVLSVVIFLSSGLAALITHEMEHHGIHNTRHVPNPYGQ